MTSPQSKWMTFLDDNLLDDSSQPNAFFWCGFNEQADISVDNSCSRKDADAQEKACSRKSVDNSCSRKDADEQEKACSRKRLRDESCTGAGNKACREKMRRDRLNDRFLELSSILEPGRQPKTDKTVILSDALRALNQMKMEAQQLKDSNDQLKESIKEMKVEKNELRDEKLRLKTEKDRLEQQMKTMAMSAGYLPHPAAVHATMVAFAAQNQPPSNKAMAIPGYSGMGMWQWMPPAALDTSQDHMLRPPVA